MEKQELSMLERLLEWLAVWLRENRLALFSGLGAGLLAHTYAFTNKLVNADEVWSLFERGASVTSGRWGLELSKCIFPSISMPWIYGLLSILLLSLAACCTIRLFAIESRGLQMLLAAAFVSFPAVTGLFCFMFTSAPYALAFLLAVLAVYQAERERLLAWVGACLLLILAIGTYQAYVALAASFFVIRMIQQLISGKETAGDVLRYGLRRVALLLVSMGIYYGICLVALSLTGLSFAEYGVERNTGIFYKTALAYSSFLRTFTRGYFAFVRSPLALVFHGILLVISAAAVLHWLKDRPGTAKSALLILCLLLFPLSVYCIFWIAETGIIHSLVLHSFVSVYVLAAVLVETVPERPGRWGRDAVLLALALIVAGNVFFANKVYLKMHFQYEQAYSIYTGLVTRIETMEGFNADKKVAIVGSGRDLGHQMDELNTEGLMGPSVNLIDIYTRDLFLQRYLGFDVRFATEGERIRLMRDPRVQEMACYPYEGSVQLIDDFVVVRLG